MEAVRVSAAAAEQERASAAESAADGGVPPLGNTGVERTGRLPGGGEMLGCGWLAGTVRGRGVEAVKGVFERRLGLVSDQGYGSKWYGASARVGDKGAVLAWSPPLPCQGRLDSPTMSR